MFALLKSKLLAAAVTIGGFLLLALGYLKHSRDKWKEKAERATFDNKQRKAVDDNLAEVDQTFSRRAALRQQEKQNEPDKVPDRLRNNNDF